MKIKKIKLDRLRYLEKNISLLSGMGTEKDDNKYAVEVQNEDGSINEEMTDTTNKMYELNIERDKLMKKIMGEEYGNED